MDKNKTRDHKLYYFLTRQKKRESKGREGKEGESKRNILIRIEKVREIKQEINEGISIDKDKKRIKRKEK
jgi:hypothetical protein